MVSCYLIKQFNNNNNNKSINLYCKTHLGNTGGHDKQGIEEVSVRNKLTGILQLRELSLYLWLIALIFIPKYFSLFWLADITSYHWPQFERLVMFLPMTSIGKKIDRKRKSKLKCFCRGQHWGLYISCFGRDGVHCLPCFSLEDYYLITKGKIFAFWHLSRTFLE